jgi:hypothetical protein
MKTPREILLARHAHVEPKLDHVRGSSLAAASSRRPAIGSAGKTLGAKMEEWLRSYRWHLAGLATAWIAVGLLHWQPDLPPTTAHAETAPPLTSNLLLALRENRRHLTEMLNAPFDPMSSETEPVQSPPIIPAPGRRGDIQPLWQIV